MRHRRTCEHCAWRWTVRGRIAGRCPRCQSASYRSRPTLGRPDATVLDLTVVAPRLRPAVGWHADPAGRFDSRWFDGEGWTERVLVAGDEAIDLNPTGLAEIADHPAHRAQTG